VTPLDATAATALGIIAATVGYCVASAMIPLLNTELYLVGVAAVTADSLRVPLVIAATLGTLVGKGTMYVAADRLMTRASPTAQGRVERVMAWLRGHRAATWPVVALSAVTGLPPFYAVTVACGLLRIGLLPFIVVSGVGRAIRFGALIFAPSLLREARL
jgi:membrane protein YqaA with SNARE-associated domain